MQIFKVLFIFCMFFIFQESLFASSKDIAKELNLIPGKKAIIQWERVFKSERKMKKYGIDKLTKLEQKELKEYLLNHAADSDHPTVAGM